jgi:hypothetical protein
MTTKRVTNGMDSYVSSKTPSRNFYTQTNLRVSQGGTNTQYAYLYFNLPFPKGVKIQSATLTLTQAGPMTGAKTISVTRVNKAFAQNKLNWTNDPGTTGATVAISKTGTPNATKWVWDLQPMLQLVASGSPWYGIRVTSNAAAQLVFHSMQSPSINYRPVLEITWSDAPDQPDQLQPSGGRVIGLDKPTYSFHYNDPSGEDGIQSVDLQVATTADLLNANNPDVWNVAAQATDSASLDSSTIAGAPALTAGTTYYWRVRVTDDSGQTSVWSLIESFSFQPKGVLSATVDGGVNVTSMIPNVDWTLTGQVQKAYQVIVLDRNNLSRKLWDSGKVTTSNTSVSLPIGVIKTDADLPRFIVRVYDTLNRQTGPGDQVYVEQVIDSVVAYDGTVPPVDAISGVSDPVFPLFNLTWTRSADPDYFLLQRRVQGADAWTYGDTLIVPDDVRDPVTSTKFTFTDDDAAMYQNYDWRILAMTGGKQSDANPVASGSVRRLTTMLVSTDKSKIVALANPSRDRSTGDIQDLVPVLDGPPVLFTQYIGGDAGHVEGLLADNFLPGYTGKQQFEWFKSFRFTPGIPFKLYVADDTFTVNIYNLEYDKLVDVEGIYYAVSFDWVAV